MGGLVGGLGKPSDFFKQNEIMGSAFITDYHISTEEKVNDLREICSNCGEKCFPIHTPLGWKNGTHFYIKLCSECFEEFENGNNPLFKQNKEESL